MYRANTAGTPERSLAEAALRVSPATFYYTIQQGGVQVGAASSALDTTAASIVAIDVVQGAIPVGPDMLRMEARSEVTFTRGLLLREFTISAKGDLTPFSLKGAVQEGKETRLSVTTTSGGEPPSVQQMVARWPLLSLTIAPLPLMLRSSPRIGDSTQVAVFDPLSRAIREATLKIYDDSLFLVGSSATWSPASGRWIAASQDSVRGWRVGGNTPSFTAWVDASGRLLAASEPGGISLVRTTAELAFENWRLDAPATGR